MRTTILGMLAETSVHAGSGRGLGVIDLPVAREAATDYPVIVGSSLKGALLDKARSTEVVGEQERDRAFGSQDAAGGLLVSDARLLLLPVRSLTTAYFWVTCPHIIERFARDLRRAGVDEPVAIPSVDKGSVAANGRSGHVFLEERQFVVAPGLDSSLVDTLKSAIPHPETGNRLGDQLAVLHDDDFAWFAKYGLAVQARNVLDDRKRSRNLWYEETLPPDTVMYALIAGRRDRDLELLGRLFPEGARYLQAGGNETVGQGWFSVVRLDGGTEGRE